MIFKIFGGKPKDTHYYKEETGEWFLGEWFGNNDGLTYKQKIDELEAEIEKLKAIVAETTNYVYKENK